jgi:hypothetical protein
LKLYFFNCSVSDDLYGASPNKSGDPLPTPAGGKWLLVEIVDSGHPDAIIGYEKDTAKSEINKWGCHWFTTTGPAEIQWDDDGPPKSGL